MKRKALNKCRSVYLNQNTPLNIIPEKKLKKVHHIRLMENKGKFRFKIKKIKEKISALIRSELMFKNKTNQLFFAKQLLLEKAKPVTALLRANPSNLFCTKRKKTGLVSQNRAKKYKEGFHQAKQVSYLNHSFEILKETQTNLKPFKGFKNPFSLTHTRSIVNKSLSQTLLPTKRFFSSSRFLCKTIENEKNTLDQIQKPGFLSYQNEKVKIHSQDLKQLVEGRGRKVSPYKAKLLERNKLSLIYGNLGWRELRKCVLQSKHRKGVASLSSGNKKTRPQTSSLPENLVTLLESRLDVVVYRCKFFPSFYSCKQAINHGKVFVNHSQVRITGHLLKPGDLIQVLPIHFKSKFAQEPFGMVAKQVSYHVENLEIEKQKTLLGLQNKIKIRNLCFSLPSSSLVRFHPLNKMGWNKKFKNQDNQQPGVITMRKDCKACEKKQGNQENLSTQNNSTLPCLTQKFTLFSETKGCAKEGQVYERIAKGASQTEKRVNHFFPSNHWLSVSHKGCFAKAFQDKQEFSPFANLCESLGFLFSSSNPKVEKMVARKTLPFKESLFYTHQKEMFEKRVVQSKTLLERNKGKNLLLRAPVKSGHTLFLDLKEKKRILRDLLLGDVGSNPTDLKKGLNGVNHTARPLPVRDNPSLFLRFQSENSLGGVRSKGSRDGSHKRKKGANSTREGLNRCKDLRDRFPSDPFPRKVRPLPKPLNLEISYETLTAIFLYPPQRVNFPAHIDLEMIGRSI